jgi:HSP20 family protein
MWNTEWDPFRPLLLWDDRPFGNALRSRSPVRRARQAFPPVNVWENEEGAVITAELPGIAAKDFDISVDGTVVTFEGKIPERKPEGTLVRQERANGGSFARSIDLGFPVDQEKVDARYKHGVLEIMVPKAASAQRKKIAVKAG